MGNFIWSWRTVFWAATRKFSNWDNKR